MLMFQRKQNGEKIKTNNVRHESDIYISFLGDNCTF